MFCVCIKLCIKFKEMFYSFRFSFKEQHFLKVHKGGLHPDLPCIVPSIVSLLWFLYTAL